MHDRILNNLKKPVAENKIKTRTSESSRKAKTSKKAVSVTNAMEKETRQDKATL